MNGGPSTGSGLDDGSYYFAVLVPGYQHDGFIQGRKGNLSDTAAGGTTNDGGNGDAASCRTFQIVSGEVKETYDTDVGTCAHGTGESPNGRFIIQLSPYDTTSNNGDVYILAICKVGATSPKDCKFDAFRVSESENAEAFDLTVSKTAAPSFTRTYKWTIAKNVDKTTVTLAGGSATFNYTVTVGKDSYDDSGWTASGFITITNPNDFVVNGVSVTDEIEGDLNASCDVSRTDEDRDTGTIAASSAAMYEYTCSYSDDPAESDQTNKATATWSGDETPTNEAAGSAEVDWSEASITDVNNTITVSDAFNGGSAGELGKADWDDAPVEFKYSRVIAVLSGCHSYDNEAKIVETAQIAGQSVEVCGPTPTGALTIGFWKGPNGQSLISGFCRANAGTYPTGSLSLVYFLRVTVGGPFASAPANTAICSTVLTYINTILKSAYNAKNMNDMLRAQMLATALNVYFSSTGWVVAGSGKTKTPGNFLLNGGIGTFSMDLTAVCPMVDNSITGTAICLSNTPSTDGVASGAFDTSPKTVLQILQYVVAQYSGSTFYGTNRMKQEIAKNVFDQINNDLAFAG